MRKSSLLSILLVIGLVVASFSAVALAGNGNGQGGNPQNSEETGNTGSNTVEFSVDNYIKLTVNQSVTELGSIAGDLSQKEFEDVNTLAVESNVSDGFTVTTEVSSQDYSGNHLEVKLANGSWDGHYEAYQASESGIDISYKVVDVDSLNSGEYSATVTFTASTK